MITGITQVPTELPGAASPTLSRKEACINEPCIIADSLLVLEGILYKATKSRLRRSCFTSPLNKMSTNDLENRPAEEANVSCAILRPLPHKADEEPQMEYLVEPSEDAIPDVKSGVRVDPNAALVSVSSFSTFEVLPTNSPAKRPLLQGRPCPHVANPERPKNQGRLHSREVAIQQPGRLRRVPARRHTDRTEERCLDPGKGPEDGEARLRSATVHVAVLTGRAQ